MSIRSVEAVDLKEAAESHHVEDSQGIAWTGEEEKKLVRKIDLFLMPNIWLMYLLSYLDRTK